jgi:hypothetical protein
VPRHLRRIEHVHVDVDVELVHLTVETIKLLPDSRRDSPNIVDAELLNL